MKKSKKILTIALSFALLTAVVQSYNTSKADSYNTPTIAQITSEVKTKDERIINAIKNLEDAKARNIDAYNRALQRLENKPTASDKLVLDKSKALIEKANAQIIKLKNYQVKEQEKPEVNAEVKKEKIEVPFKTIRKHNIPGAETRIKRQGQNGYIEYERIYKDGKVIKETKASEKAPIDQIIETKIVNKIPKQVTKTVEDKTKPIYKYEYKDRYFVRGTIDDAEGNEIPVFKLFYSYEEADAYATKYEVLGNYGSYDTEEIKTLIGYETKEITETEYVETVVWE
ncbi:G5 domain-containing protein [Anaerococcus hydrogenalis]|uniref:Conserved domain protein n=1 Tax=Anaerococcus hydrogenalis ACS-025-V-Sch4 TaxID=879306 RepID=F0H306_9FIRM|nr:G5 domain-containing protein [Anaerococcus hydrogenalis]EGC83142.1 conserved domain protein [Anaerococcus hydrogenalis ACS-025-V-Sch4]